MKLVEKYASVICNNFNITVEQLRSRDRKLAYARKWLYYICRIKGVREMSIANYIGRDRSTINDVFGRMNRIVDRSESLKIIKNKLLSEAKIN